MEFVFEVRVTVERTEGKFASRDDIGGQILEELDGCNPGSITGENDGEYEVQDWDVTELPQPKRQKRRA